jgi:two-component system, LytTR family, response regulator
MDDVMKRVLICEDEPLARETLRDFIAAWPGLALVGEASDGQQALKLVRSLAPDVVFMDIQMPELTGLDVLRQLKGHTPWPAIVFTTAYDQHAITAFELNAVDYLLKPFSQERFDTAVQRLLDDAPLPADVAEQALALTAASSANVASSSAPLQRILVRDRGQIFPLPVAEIQYLKSDSKYTLIAARGSSYFVRLALAELEPRLPPERFLRVHRNAIVNLDFVDSMKPDEQSQLEIHMRDGGKLLANREASKLLRDQAI